MENAYPDCRVENSEKLHHENRSNKNSKQIFIINKIKKIKNWTEDEDQLLLNTSKKLKFKNWNEVAKLIPGRTSAQCTARYKRIKPGIVKGAWTSNEDEKLKNLLIQYGKNWSLISKHMMTRNGKQIRDRFINSLDPVIVRDKFTSDEDNKILELYSKYGSSWSMISKCIPGRTPDIIKNRFYSTLRKQIHCWDYIESLKKRKRRRERSAINKSTAKLKNLLPNDLKKINLRKKFNIKKNKNIVKEYENILKKNADTKKEIQLDIFNNCVFTNGNVDYNCDNLNTKKFISDEVISNEETKIIIPSQNTYLSKINMPVLYRNNDSNLTNIINLKDSESYSNQEELINYLNYKNNLEFQKFIYANRNIQV